MNFKRLFGVPEKNIIQQHFFNQNLKPLGTQVYCTLCNHLLPTKDLNNGTCNVCENPYFLITIKKKQ